MKKRWYECTTEGCGEYYDTKREIEAHIFKENHSREVIDHNPKYMKEKDE